MAPVDPTTIYAVTAGIVLFIILLVTFITKFISSSSNSEKGHNAAEGQPQRGRAMEGPGGVRRRGPRINRMRVNQDDSDASQEEDALVDDLPTEGKVGAKKMRKLQDKAERKSAREQEERDREERKKREKELEEKRKEEEESQKKEDVEKEEEERQRKEEEARIEHEEYLKMKEMFTVDEEGEGEQDTDLEGELFDICVVARKKGGIVSESLLAQFVNYIKETKVVMLEDLAGHFKLKTQDVIQRVQDLQADGTLTGIIDDRGKFIYITKEELDAIARYIRQNGRVSISDLAVSSTRLINLDADHSAIVQKVAAEVGDIGDAEELAAES